MSFFLADHCSFDSNSRAPAEQLGNSFGFTAPCVNGASTTPFGPASKDDRNGNVSDVVKMDVVEDILAMLRAEDRNHGSYVFVNAEGKCNTEDQVRALLGSVRSCVGTTWYATIVAEADWLSDDRTWEDIIDGHAVHRHHAAGGRAMKVIANRKVVKYCQKIEWTNRAVRVDLVFYDCLQSAGVSLLGAHFGHGAEWTTGPPALTNFNNLSITRHRHRSCMCRGISMWSSERSIKNHRKQRGLNTCTAL